jgi:protocatechuate 4,5-dioxygenase alpha subunit
VSLYELSRACYELREPYKREQFRTNPAAYAAQYSLTETERELFLNCNWSGLAEAGVSIYVLTKLGAAAGVEFVELEAAMRGMNKEEFLKFLADQAEQNKRYIIGVE